MKTVYRPAAAIVPYKNDSLLCGLRGPGARSFKGYMVFPGGTVEPTDNTCAVLLPPRDVTYNPGTRRWRAPENLVRKLGGGCWRCPMVSKHLRTPHQSFSNI